MEILRLSIKRLITCVRSTFSESHRLFIPEHLRPQTPIRNPPHSSPPVILSLILGKHDRSSSGAADDSIFLPLWGRRFFPIDPTNFFFPHFNLLDPAHDDHSPRRNGRPYQPFNVLCESHLNLERILRDYFRILPFRCVFSVFLLLKF